MIDVGLLLSMLVAVGLPVVASTRWTPEPAGFFDRILLPLVVGVAFGRMVTVSIDDPGAFTRIGDLFVVRSGVEFWPAVAASTVVFAVSAKRDGRAMGTALATVAPLAMLGYAGYEATCVVRSGCYGPESSIGLSPPGVATTMLPIGLFAGAFIAVGAFLLQFGADRLGSVGVPVVAIIGVAGVRATASFWLPHIGDGLSRQHWASILVAGSSVVALFAHLFFVRHRTSASE